MIPALVSILPLSCRLPVAAALVLAGAVSPAAAQRAGSWVVAEAHSGRILIEQRGQQRRPVDGFATVATAVVTLDWAQRLGLDMARRTSVPAVAVGGPYANPMGLAPGDLLSFRDLLYSAVLGADDVACLTLAAAVGSDLLMRRQRHGDPVAEFVFEMNNLARAQNMRGTVFHSPHGGTYGRRRDGGFTCARDIARLGIYAMSRPAFRFYSMQGERAIAIGRGGENLRFRIRNYNPYASEAGVDGVKVVARGGGGPGAVLTSKRSHEVIQMADGRSMIYPRRVVAVADGPQAAGTAHQLLSAGWQEFDRWSAMGRPADAALTLRAAAR
jgi:serine-type D-Ala-D-Ala carboxypeptidase (penicillin-binding protein 5/6)